VHAEVERRGRGVRNRVVGRIDPAIPGTPWAGHTPVSGAARVPKPGWVTSARRSWRTVVCTVVGHCTKESPASRRARLLPEPLARAFATPDLSCRLSTSIQGRQLRTDDTGVDHGTRCRIAGCCALI